MLDGNEIHHAVNEVFMLGKLPSPTYNETVAIMRKFDTNRDGVIDRNEFKKLLINFVTI